MNRRSLKMMTRCAAFAFVLGFVICARAQSTNIQFTIKISDSNSTNQVTLNAPADYVQGFALSYRDNVRNNGTNAPSFPNFVKQEVVDRLKSLQDQATGDALATNRLGGVVPLSVWQSMTASERTNVTGIFQKYVP